MKRLVAILMVGCMLVCSCIGAMAAEFSDLAGANWDWARDAVESLSDQGIIKGYEDGTFKPDNNVTNQEAFTLFARIMGANNAIYSEVLDGAVENYSDVAANYEGIYSANEICFMLDREIFEADELDTYFASDRRSVPMKRYEAAILITKILGGEEAVADKFMYVLDYTDAADIPAEAKGYVEYVNEMGIMSGMGDGTFSPNTGVTRAQVAIMLQKTMAALDFSVVSGNITEFDTDSLTLSIDGVNYNVSDDMLIRVNGKADTLENIGKGMDAVVTLSGSGTWAIDAFGEKEPEVDNKITGVFAGSYTDTSGTFLKVYDPRLGSASTELYKTNADTSFLYEGLYVRLNDFEPGDKVVLTIKDDIVIEADAYPATTEIENAFVREINLGSKVEMIIDHSSKEYDGMAFDLSGNITVKRNGLTSSLTQLIPGDRITIVLEYDAVTSIIATGSSSVESGTITQIVIGKTNKITLDINGEEKEYALLRDTEIVLDDGDATVYDLRLGYIVNVNIQSSAVTRIEVQSVTTPSNIICTVDLVNPSLNFLNVSAVDLSTGAVSSYQVFINSTTSIITTSGTKRSIDDLSVGTRVMISGKSNVGAFEAESIVIISE